MLRETEEPWYRWTKSAHVSLYKGCPAPPKKRGEKGSLSPYKARNVSRSYHPGDVSKFCKFFLSGT